MPHTAVPDQVAAVCWWNGKARLVSRRQCDLLRKISIAEDCSKIVPFESCLIIIIIIIAIFISHVRAPVGLFSIRFNITKPVFTLHSMQHADTVVAVWPAKNLHMLQTRHMSRKGHDRIVKATSHTEQNALQNVLHNGQHGTREGSHQRGQSACIMEHMCCTTAF